MILALTKKFIPLCPLLALLVACGKKVEDSGSTEVTRSGANLPGAIVLEATATGNTSRKDHNYEVLRDGNIEIPTILTTTSTATGAHRVRLDVNLVSDEEEFHCYWIGRGSYYEFDNCEDYDGNDLGLTLENISRFKFPIDQGKYLKLGLEAAPASSTVKSRMEIQVNWI